MTTEQIKAFIREIVYGLSAVIVSFSLVNENLAGVISASVSALAVLVWSILANRGGTLIWSLARKFAQTVAPVLVALGFVNETQGATLTALVLVIVSAWTTEEKSLR